ncbi:Glycine receptor subunit alpha-2 [Penaeus vannamei]|uniref:Glycine receptor subunit alpha-2 n=1 Tax=Penaeus vannamei TaxID=6689 RepID=A0A3R7QEW6_PENVA|nr:Glycine receptor subunit alpha-2 [Penaeus vannamei]
MPPNPDKASALLQECRLVLTMLSASSRLLVFHENASEAAFVGNPHLVEYTVGRVSVEVMNQRDFAVMHVKISLVRRAGYILMNVYIPSTLLLIVSYVTLYFRVGIFQARVLGTLTALLASSHLPKTSYFKMVDVWLLTAFERAERAPPAIPAAPSPSPAVQAVKVHPSGGTAATAPSKDPRGALEFLSAGRRSSLHLRLRVRSPLYQNLILGARVVVFAALLTFNIVYWSTVFLH